MGWRFKWVSSYGNDFNHDFHVSFTPEEMARGEVYYNYDMPEFPSEEAPGVSVFYKDPSGAVFHTYSTYARGLEMLVGAYNFLDLVPKGRDEASCPGPWPGSATMIGMRRAGWQQLLIEVHRWSDKRRRDMATKVLILLGTKKGAFILESDDARRSWELRGPFCETWPMNHVIADPATGTIYGGGGNEWFGPAVWKSTDLGASWTHSSEGLAYEAGRGADQGGLEPGARPRPASMPASSRPGCSAATTAASPGGTSRACATTRRGRTGSRAAAG